MDPRKYAEYQRARQKVLDLEEGGNASRDSLWSARDNLKDILANIGRDAVAEFEKGQP
ncbi:MAG: hypothetical protein ACSLE1_01935 [Sphingobium sp.]